jgi:hypothetical protein
MCRRGFRFSETKVISIDCVTYVDASNTFSGSSYKVFHGLKISSCSDWAVVERGEMVNVPCSFKPCERCCALSN